jgi:hypothetical protein
LAGKKESKPRVSTHPVRDLSAKDQKLVERVRRICMALPEANERVSHGEPTWFAGKGKVFAMIDGHHHDSPHLSVWLPQSFDAQEALIESDPKRYFKPPLCRREGMGGRRARHQTRLGRGRPARARVLSARRGREAPETARRFRVRLTGHRAHSESLSQKVRTISAERSGGIARSSSPDMLSRR